MIELEHFMPMAYFKKEAFTGSRKGMRYRVKKVEDVLEAAVYPEPYGYDATAKEDKTIADFPFTEEGRVQAVAWLNEQFEVQKEKWDKAARK